APPRRPARPRPVSSSTRTPRDCSSTTSRRSSSSRTPLPTAGEELLVVLPEDPLLELLRDAADPVQLPVLAVEVRPRLVGAEEHPVPPHRRGAGLGGGPGGPEPDGPRRVGGPRVAVLPPLEELGPQLDGARPPAPEGDEVDLAALPVALHQGDEVVDVGAPA